MHLFNPSEPLIQTKQEALDVQDRVGLKQLHWQIGKTILISRFYTRIDQVFILWSLVALVIFATAQFLPVSWVVQNYFWTGLTLIAVIGMTVLTWFWATVERLRWIVYSWAGLMLVGLVLTNGGFFWGWWWVLPLLCPLWLALSAIGYLICGLGMQSRTFLITAGLHGLGILGLPIAGSWQFLATGLVIAGSLLFLSEVQWDMRSPIDFATLTPEQQQFNRQQQLLRQLALQQNG